MSYQDVLDRAQRWHDTDHGDFIGVSVCWCCCNICDPDWNPGGRTNPHWSEADATFKVPDGEGSQPERRR